MNQRLRTEFIAGAEDECRKRTGRPMTAEELERSCDGTRRYLARCGPFQHATLRRTLAARRVFMSTASFGADMTLPAEARGRETDESCARIEGRIVSWPTRSNQHAMRQSRASLDLRSTATKRSNDATPRSNSPPEQRLEPMSGTRERLDRTPARDGQRLLLQRSDRESSGEEVHGTVRRSTG